jgi:hypothetical protein
MTRNVRSRAGATALFALALLLGVQGCRRYTPEEREFLELSPDDRRQVILESPPAQRVDFYMLAMNIHPPDLSLAAVVASRGEEVVPALVERLSAETQGIYIFDLVRVLREMEVYGYYPVAVDDDLMAFLEEKVTGMDQSPWRERLDELLLDIREGVER